MIENDFDFSLKPYQLILQTPFLKVNHLTTDSTRLFLELFGVNNYQMEKIFSYRPGRIPASNSPSLKIWHVRGAKLENFADRVEKEIDCERKRLKYFDRNSATYSLREVKTTLNQLKDRIKMLEGNHAVAKLLPDSEPIPLQKYYAALNQIRSKSSNFRLVQKTIAWESHLATDYCASASGVDEFRGSVQNLIDNVDDELQTLIVILPLSIMGKKLKKHYNWHCLERTFNDIDESQALAFVTALQLINEQEQNSVMRDLIVNTQLEEYFGIASWSENSSGRYYIYSKDVNQSIKKYSLLRIKTGKGKYKYTSKTIYSDRRKRLQIAQISFYLSIIASHCDGIFLTLRLPKSNRLSTSNSPILYAPSSWINLLTPFQQRKDTRVTENLESPRKTLAEAFKSGSDAENQSFKFDYDTREPNWNFIGCL